MLPSLICDASSSAEVRSPARPAHGFERLIDAAVGRDGNEALVSLSRDIDLLGEVQEHIRSVGHQELRELRVVALALGLTARASRRLEDLVHLRVLVVGEVAPFPLARMPDRIGKGIGIVEVGPSDADRLEVRREQLLDERGPIERLEPRLGADVLEIFLQDDRGVLHRLVGLVVAEGKAQALAVLDKDAIGTGLPPRLDKQRLRAGGIEGIALHGWVEGPARWRKLPRGRRGIALQNLPNQRPRIDGVVESAPHAHIVERGKILTVAQIVVRGVVGDQHLQSLRLFQAATSVRGGLSMKSTPPARSSCKSTTASGMTR